MSLDLHLIGGKFFDLNFPPELSYLENYFKSDLGRTFVAYYFMFNELIAIKNSRFFVENFIDHTGYRVSRQRLLYLLKRIQCITKLLKEAELSFDLDQVEKIKAGKFKFNDKIS